MLKRICALFVCLTLLLLLFAACGKKSPPSPSPSGDPSLPSGQPEKTASPAESSTSEPATEPTETPAETPDPTEEPKRQPDLTIEDGVTYLTLEGVRILLVNKRHALPPDFGGEHAEASAALSEMIAAAAGDGISLSVVSGYRSYDTQDAIYHRYVGQSGKEEADTFSARPGHSEHQTGMAFDLNSLKSSFRDTAEYAWLIAHAADYGFILRFTEGGQWATGYMFEPWHYRYIGDAALARRIMESGEPLEVYAGLVTEEGQSGYLEDAEKEGGA